MSEREQVMMTAREVAKHLRCDVETVYRWVRRDMLVVFRSRTGMIRIPYPIQWKTKSSPTSDDNRQQ